VGSKCASVSHEGHLRVAAPNEMFGSKLARGRRIPNVLSSITS